MWGIGAAFMDEREPAPDLDQGIGPSILGWLGVSQQGGLTMSLYCMQYTLALQFVLRPPDPTSCTTTSAAAIQCGQWQAQVRDGPMRLWSCSTPSKPWP